MDVGPNLWGTRPGSRRVYCGIMVSALECHLALLEREALNRPTPSGSEGADRLDEVIALHVGLYEVMERRVGPNGLSDAHRTLVPMFRRWLATARLFVADARDLRAAGRPVVGVDDLLRAINRAKPIAEDFEHIVTLNGRVARGQGGSYRPLAGVVDELRTGPQPPR